MMDTDDILRYLDAAHKARTLEATDATTPMSTAAEHIRKLAAQIDQMETEIKMYRQRVHRLNEDLMDAHWRLKLGTRD